MPLDYTGSKYQIRVLCETFADHKFQISVFGAVAIVFSVFGVNEGIFTTIGSLDAMAAGWLVLAIVNVCLVVLNSFAL